MNFQKYFLAICILFVISACSTPPTPVATQTPELTQIPMPKPFTGKLFFDMNGSGLQDESSFVYDPERLNDERQPLQPDLVKPIKDYIAAHPSLKKGDLVTIPEPGLSGYQVCIEKDCVLTGEDGSFSVPNNTGHETAQMKIIDPYADQPALAMRYINEWKGIVNISDYEKNGKKIPKQALNDTKIIPLANNIQIQSNHEDCSGLLQGFLTLPYEQIDFSNYWISNYVDTDPTIGRIILFNKKTNMKWSRPKTEQNRGGDGDSHNGIDFEGPENTYIIAAFSGKVYDTTTQSPILLLGNMEKLPFKISNGHHNGILVKAGYVFRGQIIGLNGTSANGQHPHNHFGLYKLRNNNDARIGPDDLRIDPYGSFWVDKTTTISYLSGEKENLQFSTASSWTVYNLPQFPLVG